MAENKARAPITILIVLIIISLGFAGLTFYYLQQEYKRNTTLQAELDDVKTRYGITETKLQQSQEALSEKEEELNKTKLLIESLEDDLNKAVQDKQDALSRTAELELSLAGQMKLRSELENKLIESQNEAKNIREQIEALESRKTGLETRLKELEEKSRAVELGKIIVGSESQDLAAAAPQPVIEPLPVKKQPEKSAVKESNPEPAKSAAARLAGKVLVVNKEYDFAVINLGSKDGIEADNLFAVYHSEKYIGDLKIEKVHESMSAAGFLSPKIKNRINEGDRVVQKKK